MIIALQISQLVVGYSGKPILTGVDLEVGIGEIVAITGYNGAGKSTLLKAIFGLLSVLEGQIIIFGAALKHHIPSEVLQLGVSYVPQGNRVFADLTVGENLEIGGLSIGRGRLGQQIDRVLAIFPALRSRIRQQAGTLSGGERQMLSIGTALIRSPRLLLLDEPLLGLDATIFDETLKYILKINTLFRTTIVIVDHRMDEVVKVAHRSYIMREGRMSTLWKSNSARGETEIWSNYL